MLMKIPSFISEALGSGGETDTGWVQVTIDLPDLTASSTYNLSTGILHTSSAKKAESSYVKFDDVLLTGVDEVPITTLNGQDGLDDLYGSVGTDIFLFETASAFNDIDLVNNFSTANRDALDIKDLLTGYTGVEDITEWVQITDDGTDSTLSIDADGLVDGSTYLAIATIVGVIGLTDEVALEAAGNLTTL